MKKHILAVMVLCLLVLCTCTKSSNKYTNGSYLGQAEGHHGTIKVQVTIDNKVILDITILEEQEIPGLKEIVYKKIPKAMKRRNTWDVDAISGATLTSTGLINAVKDALEYVRE